MTSEKDNAGALIEKLGHAARSAARALAEATPAAKNAALKAATKAIRADAKKILAANAKDMKAGKEVGMSKALLDRLELNDKRIEAMAKSIEEIAKLPDPVGRKLAKFKRPNGLVIERISVPLGVIGVIY